MSDTDVGKTARRAFEFMRQFYRDVQALVTTVEQQLGTKNWHTALGSKIAERSSNRLWLVDAWMPEALTRIYARLGQADRAKEALGLSIEFAPQSFDEPISLVVGVRFSRPSSCKTDLWSRWKTSDEVLAMLPQDGTSAEISRTLPPSTFACGGPIATTRLIRRRLWPTPPEAASCGSDAARCSYPSASEALTAVTARSSQRSRVVRSVHASMRASSSVLSGSCRRASTRRRAAPASLSLPQRAFVEAPDQC